MPASQRRASLIYNPNAGFWDWHDAIDGFAQFWKRQGWSLEVESTERPNHATELARAAVADGQRLIFAAGGDGTLNEVANALAGTDAVLAPLPAGTANVLAKEFGLALPNILTPTWMLQVSRSLAAGRIQRMDVGQSEESGRYWLLWASTGVDGYIVNQVEPRSRWLKRLGKLGYLAKALLHLPSYRSPHAVVTVDDRTLEGEYLMVSASNIRMFLGGEVNLNHNAVLDDGQFEIWRCAGEWSKLAEYALEMTLEQHERDPDVTVLTGRNVAVRCSPPINITWMARRRIRLSHRLRYKRCILVPDTA